MELSPWVEERKTESKREREREKDSVSVTPTGSQGRVSQPGSPSIEDAQPVSQASRAKRRGTQWA
jgi:hypothetical protein